LEIEAPHPSDLSLTRIYRSRNIGLNYIHTEDIHLKRMLTKAGKFAKMPTAILIRGKSRREKSILAQGQSTSIQHERTSPASSSALGMFPKIIRENDFGEPKEIRGSF
jgi:hypothetical protein